MENSLIDSILETCKILNSNKVEYLIVGGTAVVAKRCVFLITKICVVLFTD